MSPFRALSPHRPLQLWQQAHAFLLGRASVGGIGADDHGAGRAGVGGVRVQMRTAVWFWRIVPVGFATMLLSAFSLGLLSLGVASQETDAPAEGSGLEFLSLVAVGLLVTVFAAPVWLPLAVVWNIIVHRLRPRFGLLHAATLVSGAMALPLPGLVGAVLVRNGVVLVGLVWPTLTAAIAARLTWIAFRSVAKEGGEQPQ